MRALGFAIVAVLFLLPGLPARADSGKAGYEKLCAGCHGTDGRADTKKGQKLKAANYFEVKELAGPGAVEFIEKTVRENKKHRPVNKKVSDADLAAIAQYVQSMVAAKK